MLIYNTIFLNANLDVHVFPISNKSFRIIQRILHRLLLRETTFHTVSYDCHLNSCQLILPIVKHIQI